MEFRLWTRSIQEQEKWEERTTMWMEWNQTRAVRQVRASEVCSFGQSLLNKASSTYFGSFTHFWQLTLRSDSLMVWSKAPVGSLCQGGPQGTFPPQKSSLFLNLPLSAILYCHFVAIWDLMLYYVRINIRELLCSQLSLSYNFLVFKVKRGLDSKSFMVIR